MLYDVLVAHFAAGSLPSVWYRSRLDSIHHSVSIGCGENNAVWTRNACSLSTVDWRRYPTFLSSQPRRGLDIYIISYSSTEPYHPGPYVLVSLCCMPDTAAGTLTFSIKLSIKPPVNPRPMLPAPPAEIVYDTIYQYSDISSVRLCTIDMATLNALQPGGYLPLPNGREHAVNLLRQLFYPLGTDTPPHENLFLSRVALLGLALIMKDAFGWEVNNIDREQRQAFGLAQHPRVGAASPARIITDRDLLRKITWTGNFTTEELLTRFMALVTTLPLDISPLTPGDDLIGLQNF